VQSDAHLIAQFVTQVTDPGDLPGPVEVQITIRRAGAPLPAAVTGRAGPDNVAEASSYVYPVKTNLSAANKQGLDNLVYWRNGFRASRVYIFNQALAQYQAQCRESQWTIPPDETK